MLITGEIRILFSVEDAEIEEQAKLFWGACPNGDAVKQAVLLVFLVVMLVVLFCVVNMDLAPEQALIQVARVERQQPRDEEAERRSDCERESCPPTRTPRITSLSR